MDSTHNGINRLRRYLEGSDKIGFAFVFGSYARGEQRPDSDIDVGVYFERKHIPKGFEILQFEQKLSEVAEKEVDLVVLNVASSFLRHQIQKNYQILVLQNKLAYTQYREQTMRDYDEYRYLNPERSYA